MPPKTTLQQSEPVIMPRTALSQVSGRQRHDAGEAFGKFTEPAIMPKAASPTILAAEGMMRAKSRKPPKA